ncbi:MAG: hypothetical protein VYC83_04030 [Chloroflexota bacterium]|nr:hypothetical protein [Chloroflexota bacterium]MED5587945.1 hypothetical protein [Chloroflexota bacterium]
MPESLRVSSVIMPGLFEPGRLSAMPRREIDPRLCRDVFAVLLDPLEERVD